jgi:hypothetical protein
LRGSSKKFEHKLTKEKLLFRITEYATRCFLKHIFFILKKGGMKHICFFSKKDQRRKDNCAINEKRSVENRAVARCGILI